MVHFLHKRDDSNSHAISPISLPYMIHLPRSPAMLAALLAATSVLAVSLPVESSQALLVTSSIPTAALPACLQSSYFGAYGGSSKKKDHVFMPSGPCIEELSRRNDLFDSVDQGSLVTLPDVSDSAGRIVWIGHAGMEGAMSGMTGLSDAAESWSGIAEKANSLLASAVSDGTAQRVLSAEPDIRHDEPIQLLRSSTSSMLVHVLVSFLPILDTLLPSHLVPVALPVEPYPAEAFSPEWEPVPAHFGRHLANLTKNLKFSPEIDRIVSDGVRLDDVRRNIRWLTGEAPSGIETRHSFTPDARKAANWIKCASSYFP